MFSSTKSIDYLPPENDIQIVKKQQEEETVNTEENSSNELNNVNFERINSYVSKIQSLDETKELGLFIQLLKKYNIISALKNVSIGKEDDYWAIKGNEAKIEIHFPETEVSGLELIKQGKSCEPTEIEIESLQNDYNVILSPKQKIQNSINITFPSLVTDNLHIVISKPNDPQYICLNNYYVLKNKI